jgi:UDP-N-acetylglucosamine 2-epimerase (non-hydrolysing)
MTAGSNYLTGVDPNETLSTAEMIHDGKGKKFTIPKYWDGKSGERIISIIARYFKTEAPDLFP